MIVTAEDVDAPPQRTPTRPSATPWRLDAGFLACALAGVLLLAFALAVDFPKAAFGFQSDEATYYMLGHSLALDGDFTYERGDLVRVWEEFPTGPEGIFLKRGRSLSLEGASGFPFVRLLQRPDPRTDRLYFAKSFAYPLAAAPFVRLFGTNGFLVLHALLLTGALAAAYAFLRARASAGAALAYASVFFVASAAPVYFVWLTPELFNLCLCLYGLFLWCYKEVAPPLIAEAHPAPASRTQAVAWWWSKFLRRPASTIAGAALVGIATFSKPTNVFVIAPILALPLLRRQWRTVVTSGAVFGAVVAGLFLLNLLITGELNYQGGAERNTFYGGLGSGFPFQSPQSTFDTGGLPRATNVVPTDVLFNRNALVHVLPHNLVYFTLGRHTGLVPYFFPGVLSVVLWLVARRGRSSFQWLVLAAFAGGCLALLVYMPFTYSGGGGPIGNRYFLGLYPLMLFVTPALRSWAPAFTAAFIGGLFTTPLVLNPFYASFHPAEHTKRGAYRLLPVELSLLNDLPVNVTANRVRQPLGGDPPVSAYFLDDNAYPREGEWFWVRGESRADIALRAPARRREDGTYDTLRIRRLVIEIRSGDVPNEVTVQTGAHESQVALQPRSSATVTAASGNGLPYKPMPGQPTNYVYFIAIASKTGFTPLFTAGTRDARFLGAFVRIVPLYE